MNIEDQIRKAITCEIEKAIAEEAAEAGKRVERRVRERTAAIASVVLDKWTFERMGSTLKIIVDIRSDPTDHTENLR